MKNFLIIIIAFITLQSCNTSQNIPSVDIEKPIKEELVGVWEFKILNDEFGNKVDTIWHGIGFEIPKGPLITLRNDGTYSKQFTPNNIDTGKWYFDEKENEIVFLLYYSKPYGFVENDLIKRGHAKKDKKGDYYEKVTNKVFNYSENELILLEREKRRRTFTRKK